MERQSFNEKMRKVAELLNYNWEESDSWDDYGYLVGLYGVKISVRRDSFRNRIRFNPVFPGVGENCYIIDNKTEITVAGTKTGEQISRDVQKRFLSTYLINLQEMNRKSQEVKCYEAKKSATIKKVADYLGKEVRNNSQIFPEKIKEIYKIEGESDEFVRFKVQRCTPEKAIKVIELLKQS